MDLIKYILNNTQIWAWYFIISAIISLLCGAANFPRFYQEFKEKGCCERLFNAVRFAVYDSLVILLGCVLLFVQLQLLLYIFLSQQPTDKIVSGILYLISLPYVAFCLSGRGIDVN